MRISTATFPTLFGPLVAASLMLWTSHVYAWGNLGHRITGLIAEELLTPTAKHDVESLLSDETLVDAATFMDTHRDELQERWPGSSRWHYDNREVCGNKLMCRDGNCATTQIEHFQAALADKNTPRQQRAMALRLVIHMIGDIHQPLHMADNHDRGGNDVWVRAYSGAERRSLHQLYDTGFVLDVVNHRRDLNFAHQLVSSYRSLIPQWQRGDVQSWSEESYQLGVHDVYAKLPGFSCSNANTEFRTLTLPPEYISKAHEDIELQLVKAGARIAATLNAILH